MPRRTNTPTLCEICKAVFDGACKCSDVDKARRAQITTLERMIATKQKRARILGNLSRFDEMNAVLDEVAALQAALWALRAQQGGKP